MVNFDSEEDGWYRALQLLANMEGSELTIWLKDGQNFSMDLTANQLGIVLSVLGFRMQDKDTYVVFSDETLRDKIGPRLKRLNDSYDGKAAANDHQKDA